MLLYYETPSPYTSRYALATACAENRGLKPPRTVFDRLAELPAGRGGRGSLADAYERLMGKSSSSRLRV